MSIINADGKMPLEWFISPTNEDFPKQLADIVGTIEQNNISFKWGKDDE